jgi:predicted transcriptional regulator
MRLQKKIKTIVFNQRDITILMMIELGATSATDIATVLGISKQTVSEKVQRFIDCELAIAKQVARRSQFIDYELTVKGKKWLTKVLTIGATLELTDS